MMLLSCFLIGNGPKFTLLLSIRLELVLSVYPSVCLRTKTFINLTLFGRLKMSDQWSSFCWWIKRPKVYSFYSSSWRHVCMWMTLFLFLLINFQKQIHSWNLIVFSLFINMTIKIITNLQDLKVGYARKSFFQINMLSLVQWFNRGDGIEINLWDINLVYN